MTTSEIIFNIIVWSLDIGVLVRLLFQGEKMISMEKERLGIERKSFAMMSERWSERAKWRESKRKQQERKAVPASETSVGPIPADGSYVAENMELPEGSLRNLPQATEKSEYRS